MTDIHLKKLHQVILVFIAFLFCIFLAGCSEPLNSDSNMDSAQINSDKEFQKQINRPQTSKTLFAMADILAHQGRDTECEFVLKRIVRENPTYLPAYNSLAELQMRQGRTNTAIETIQNAMKIHSVSPDLSQAPILLNNLGVCWIVRGKYENALEMFTKAAGIKPENSRYRANMAVALGLMGRDEESLSLFKQVLPKDQAKHNLSVLQESRKNSNSSSASQTSP